MFIRGVKKTLLLSASAFVMFSANAQAKAETFDEFLDSVRAELSAKHMNVNIFNQAMQGVKAPDTEVQKALKRQPESTFTFSDYLNRLASETRIQNGLAKKEKHKTELDKIEAQYGLPQEVVLALWGVESAYGKLPGDFKIIPSLASLAYKSHRRDFFRDELIKAVKIVDDGHIDLDNMEGSWAGAMGQCQFMPSSFYRFGADGNGDGRIDIWNTEEDVFASASNYITKSGWDKNAVWGEAVTLGKILPKIELSSRGLSEPQPLKEWYKLGVKHKSKSAKKKVSKDQMARLFMPDGPSGRTYLVYNNFDVIMKWNYSSYFAFSVLTLADQIAGRDRL